MLKHSKTFFSCKKNKDYKVLDDPHGMRVLFWRAKGSSKRIIKLEINFARFLMSKGAKVRFVLCQGTLNGCISHNVLNDDSKVENVKNWPSACSQCYYTGQTFLEHSRMPHYSMNRWISTEDRLKFKTQSETINIEDIEQYKLYDIPVGDIAITGVFRYFRSLETGRNIDLSKNNPYLERIMREYFYSSLVSTHTSQKSFDEVQPQRVFMLRGVYPLWGPAVYTAIKRNIPVTCWGYGYNKESVFMRTLTSDDFEQIHTPNKKHWLKIKNDKISEEENLCLDMYMTNRINNISKSNTCQGNIFPSTSELRQELNITPNKQIWLICSHCNWDWDIYEEKKIIFRDPVEWLIKTVEIAIKNTDVEWILRTHPAENMHNTRLLCRDILLQKFGSMPPHIKLITCGNNKNDKDCISTYSLFPLVNGCVTMQSTVGYEMALFGKSVVLGDHGFYGNKGFTHNAKTMTEYCNFLNNIETIEPISVEQIELAKRYVYDFIFFRQIPFRDKKNDNKIRKNPVFKMIYDRMVDLEQIGCRQKPLKNIKNPEQYNWRKCLIEGWKNV